jgi:thioredoxin 1
MGSIVELNDVNFEWSIEKGVVLVDFFATWCGPCKKLSPILEQLAGELKGKVVIGKINIESDQSTPEQYQVTSFPTMILFKDGQEKDRMVGLRDVETVKKFIMTAL